MNRTFIKAKRRLDDTTSTPSLRKSHTTRNDYKRCKSTKQGTTSDHLLEATTTGSSSSRWNRSAPSFPNQSFNSSRRDGDHPLNRSIPSASSTSKNIAFNRLKRLRATLEYERVNGGKPPDDDVAAFVSSTPKKPCNSSIIATTSSDESFRLSECEDVEMEWTPIEENELINNIRFAREQLQKKLVPLSQSAGEVRPAHNDRGDIFIVVDTNVFIDRLQTITNIMNISYDDNSCPVIYVPWMVIQELDYFKDGYSVSEKHPISKKIQSMCRRAINFINQSLLASKTNLRGQSIREATETNIKSTNPDDAILACCFQLQRQGNNNDIILLSSDKNLRNKALINEIKTYAPSEIVKVLLAMKHTRRHVDLIDAISTKLALLFSFIIHAELRAYYGEALFQQKEFKQLPWTFGECVSYMQANFTAAFAERLQKQCLKVIDDFNEILNRDRIISETQFIELSLSLLYYTKLGLPAYTINIERAIDEIKLLERTKDL